MSATYDILQPGFIDPVPASPPEGMDAPPQASRRLLGAAALTGAPSNLFEHVVEKADDYTLEQSRQFAHTVHDVLVARIQDINTRRGREPNSFLLSPTQVRKDLDLYYAAFKTRAAGNVPSHLEDRWATFMQTHIEIARQHQHAHPEINLLNRLIHDLEVQASTPAANAATELLAAYGVQFDPQRAETRLELARVADVILRD